MFEPDSDEGCPSCSFLADSFDAVRLHLAQRSTTLAVVSRATLPEIEAFKKRMGWHFKWVSSFSTDFNADFHVSFTKDEMASGKAYYNYQNAGFPSEEGPGLSAFCKRGEDIFHTYSTYARGLDILIPTYNFLDMTAQGRDEDSLPPYPAPIASAIGSTPKRPPLSSRSMVRFAMSSAGEMTFRKAS